jgi:CRP-like cAMP-binding protein
VSYAPNELIIKPGDPALFMFTIRRGLAAKAGAIMAAGMYFGDDFLLASFFRPYTVRALTFLDCFRMDRTVLFQLFQYGQFPLFQVCARAVENTC